MEWCEIRNEIKDIINNFITFENEEFFDHPSSARTLHGLILTFNELAMNNAARSIVKLNLINNNMDILIGCNDTIVESTLSNVIQSDQI
jgi:hypothetical protein